jgi:hypothetical protein
MRIICTADLHGQLPDIPECDLLLIAGDVCPVEDHDPTYQRKWSTKFRLWLADEQRVQAERIVWIAGNHDFSLELGGPGRRFFSRVPRAT